MITKVTIEKTAVFGDDYRGIGRTTAEMLATIASALLSPDQWVTFRDHSGRKTQELLAIHAGVIRRMGKDLFLTIDVRVARGVVKVRSPITGMLPAWLRKH